MGLATNIRSLVRNIITKFGSSASYYNYADATKTQDDEGHVTVSAWGTATSFSIISSNHHKVRAVMMKYAEDSDDDDRIILIRDDQITPAQKDKVVIGDDSYEVMTVKLIDPIQNTTIAYRVVLKEPTWSES